jgi:hypothetical protein
VESTFGGAGTFNKAGFTSSPILDILNVFAVVFTQTEKSILLSINLAAGIDEKFKLKN